MTIDPRTEFDSIIAAEDPAYFDSLLAEADQRAPHTSAPAAPERSYRDRMLSLDQISALPPPQPLISGIIDLDSLAIFYGKRGSAKSFLAVDLTASVATGTRWFTREVAISPVIYVVAEGVSGTFQRYQAWARMHPISNLPGPDRLLLLPEPVNLLSPSSAGKFADEAAEFGAKFIVFDTLSRCMVGGDENSAKDAGLAVEQLDLIRRRTAACVAVVHHSGKLAGSGARGSSAFEAAADSVFEIANAEGLITVTCTKQKNHPEGTPIRMRLAPAAESMTLEVNRGGNTEAATLALVDTLRSLRSIELAGGVTNGAWRDQMIDDTGKTEPTFNRYRKQLIDGGFVENTGTDKMPRYQVSETGHRLLDGGTDEEF